MKKLKIILQSDFIYYLFLLITFIYVFIYIKSYKPEIIYNQNQHEFTLTIKEYKIDGDKLSLEFNENLVGSYYFKREEEKENMKLNINDKLYVYGTLDLPKNNTIPNTFNYKKYLFYKDIQYILNIEKIIKHEINNNIFYKIKNLFINRIKNINNEYLFAFILGETNYINEDVYNNYQVNGITHLFSLSALHVSVFSLTLYFILNKLKINEIISLIIVTIFLLLFSFISSFSASMLRATIFFLLRKINKIFDLNIKIINLFYITLIILLFINPCYIFNNGFILSFVITYFILIYSSKNKNVGSLKISIISLLSSLPIIINMNYEINIIGFINNILFIPYVSYIIFPLTFITFLIPKISLLLNPLIKIMEFVSLISSNILNINLIIPKLTFIQIVIYYLVLYVSVIKYKKLFIILILFIIYIQIKPMLLKDINIYFIDVLQADLSLINMKDKNIMIDTGGKISYEKEEWQKRKNEYNQTNEIITFMKSIGVRKLDYLIITHGDFDHMGNAKDLVENFKVEKVIFNCGEFNELELDLIEVLDKKKIPYYSCIRELNIDDNKLYFLNNSYYGNENDNSSVIYTKLSNYKFLFMGDAGVEVEEDILKKYKLRDIYVLKVGHHGSKTSSGKKFINDVNPKYSIISVGRNNRYGHPNNNVLENLKNSRIYRTDKDGSIMFDIKKNKIRIETCVP